ncbi:hypothetical protein Pcinc_041974 [Petrolisthes cinctipes]|uniref:Uncharacterized protein n=1 Tax=Petrolisthes cinctipes TaxID=88211 RepID=A0AAE1BJN9_PETCI|nr:hypothetical protein Pcinc_041974 [Petrolisthes cinctipes]
MGTLHGVDDESDGGDGSVAETESIRGKLLRVSKIQKRKSADTKSRWSGGGGGGGGIPNPLSTPSTTSLHSLTQPTNLFHLEPTSPSISSPPIHPLRLSTHPPTAPLHPPHPPIIFTYKPHTYLEPISANIFTPPTHLHLSYYTHLELHLRPVLLPPPTHPPPPHSPQPVLLHPSTLPPTSTSTSTSPPLPTSTSTSTPAPPTQPHHLSSTH